MANTTLDRRREDDGNYVEERHLLHPQPMYVGQQTNARV